MSDDYDRWSTVFKFLFATFIAPPLILFSPMALFGDVGFSIGFVGVCIYVFAVLPMIFKK